MPAAVTIGLVGDVCLADGPAPGAFAGVERAFGAADVLIGNCERPYGPGAPAWGAAAHPAGACPPGCHGCELRRVGFGVLTCANNHTMDLGPAGLDHTVELLGSHGIATAGAGPDRGAAGRPVTVVAAGLRVAVVARTTVCRPGHEAGPGTPGVAKVRVDTRYVGVEPDPGVPPRIETEALGADVEDLSAAVAAARRGADVVVASMHWGVKFLPHLVADYEVVLARAAVDAGADLVVGHHQHLLKGMAVVGGAPVLHGIGNFVMPVCVPAGALERYEADFHTRYAGFGLRRSRSHPLYPFHPLARMTAVVLVTLGEAVAPVVEVVPCVIGPDGLPRAVGIGSSGGRRVWRHLREASRGLGWSLGVEPAVRRGVPVGRVSLAPAGE